jgi:hypothetical protein
MAKKTTQSNSNPKPNQYPKRCWHRLHELLSEVKASIDDRLITYQQV